MNKLYSPNQIGELVTDAKKQFTGNFALHLDVFGYMAVTPVNQSIQGMIRIDNEVNSQEDHNTLVAWVFDAFNHNIDSKEFELL